MTEVTYHVTDDPSLMATFGTMREAEAIKEQIEDSEQLEGWSLECVAVPLTTVGANTWIIEAEQYMGEGHGFIEIRTA